MEEIWKAIEGYEGLYEISNTGIVKSIGRKYRWNSTKFISCNNGRFGV